MILKRGKIYWKISEESVIAFDTRQATVYHVYGCSNRKPLELMKNKLLFSNQEEYGNWIEAISLATEVKIKGYGTKLQTDWFNDIKPS